jgi:hypothetical protein
MFGLPNVSMFRFTPRDLFWLTVVCAILCGWALTYKIANDREATQRIGVGR